MDKKTDIQQLQIFNYCSRAMMHIFKEDRKKWKCKIRMYILRILEEQKVITSIKKRRRR